MKKRGNGTKAQVPERELILTRVLDAPREIVFKAWTDPKQAVHWWGPKGFTSPVCKADLRKGGVFHYCMRGPDGKDYWNKGIYHEIVVPEKIVSTIFFSDRDGNFVEPSKYGFGTDFPSAMLDMVTFTALKGGKTRLTAHRNTPLTIARRYQEEEGWNQSLDRFEEVVKKLMDSEIPLKL